MKNSILVVAMLMLGCSNKDLDKVCESDMAGLVGGHAELNCGRLDYNLRLARHIAVERGLMTREEWDRKFKNVTIIVLAEVFIPNPYGVGETVGGYFNHVTNEMFLSTWHIKAMHESLHLRDNDGPFHDGWKTNGNQDAIDFFEKNYLGNDFEYEKRVGFKSLPDWYKEEVNGN